MKMNNYWQSFYKKEKVYPPTDFAKSFTEKYNLSLVELGCGNGRDSHYLANLFKSVIACDYACWPIGYKNLTFIKEDLSQTLKRKCPDVVYSRFFLHCLTNDEIVKILKWTKRFFVAEFRIKGDKPKLYKHKRNLIDQSWFIKQLYDLGFEYNITVGRGLAKFKTEDPLIMRVYAEKIK
jgi:hypothetical protein